MTRSAGVGPSGSGRRRRLAGGARRCDGRRSAGSGAAPPSADSARPARWSPARSSSPSSRGSSIGSARSGARNGTPRSRAATTATSSSRFVRASTARVDAVGRPRRASPARPGPASSAASGASTSRPVARGPGEDPLREPLPVVLDQPDRPRDDRPRAAVVRLEVDAPQPGQRGRQAQDASHVGQPPAVDRLVVVADEEHVVRRARRGAARAPAGSGRGPAPRPRAACARRARQRARRRASACRQRERPDHEVVEVDAAGLRGPRRS